MGTDNLHHKRKQQTLRALKRKSNDRKPYDTVLIVCEGIKTEPNYLQAYCDEKKLSNANIKIAGRGENPSRVVDFSLKEYNRGKSNYDRIYCVFDMDMHPCYQESINRINILRERRHNPIPIYAIASVPCFEYWLLLHFVESTRLYTSTGEKSASELVCDDVRHYIRDYQKNNVNIYHITKQHLTIAIDRAKRLRQNQSDIGTDNPSTNMYELIEYLEQIQRRK
ncbi:RloB family protein [Legionella pneumophila serogroup 1]|uniref:RloB family protein n=1 Tax=Legionella pneumophila TaxID=446 RepID=UPI000788B902|nr:RloB family protein [Legionella pneumophila]MCZ4679690.1 RloB family protein [Legionella pneumophila]MCZ4749729.1 RloB family protein [Legionella pneumophila]HAT1994491.1 RloB domain-containing protein [Legionella pneumophila]HAT2052137.1 RloB domain-containing protein [Legionella pneumophila]HAT4435907.1 RloB domain-containing protein [Legionella pneumophila]